MAHAKKQKKRNTGSAPEPVAYPGTGMPGPLDSTMVMLQQQLAKERRLTESVMYDDVRALIFEQSPKSLNLANASLKAFRNGEACQETVKLMIDIYMETASKVFQLAASMPMTPNEKSRKSSVGSLDLLKQQLEAHFTELSHLKGLVLANWESQCATLPPEQFQLQRDVAKVKASNAAFVFSSLITAVHASSKNFLDSHELPVRPKCGDEKAATPPVKQAESVPASPPPQPPQSTTDEPKAEATRTTPAGSEPPQ